jgi:hypothetical protein
MNNFQKLAQLNRDIELLENAGKFDAAEVLQRKFVREAQLGIGPAFPQVGRRQPQMGNFQLATNPVSNIAPNYDPMFDGQVSPQGAPHRDYEGEVTKGQMFAQGLGNAAMQQQQTYNQYENPELNAQLQTNRANSVGDNANQMQAQNTIPGDVEPRLYQTSIQQISNLLNTKMPENRDKAQQIYENTIGQFKDPKRKQAFGNQFQQIVSRNFPAKQM